MKKKLILLCMVILSLFSVGCNKTIELTDEENYLIAEYAAELLIKYDRNFNFKYFDYDPYATEATTEELTTEAEVTEEATTEAEPDDATSSDAQTDGTATDIPDATEYDSSYNIAEIIDEEGILINYAYFMIVDQYPSYDDTGVYIEIDAPEGYKLLVLKFNLENTTTEDKELDLYAKDVDYRIIINNQFVAKQMLTILTDDLYTYQGTLEGSMFQETVLLYQVSDSIAENINQLKLKVTYGDKEATISLE